MDDDNHIPSQSATRMSNKCPYWVNGIQLCQLSISHVCMYFFSVSLITKMKTIKKKLQKPIQNEKYKKQNHNMTHTHCRRSSQIVKCKTMQIT